MKRNSVSTRVNLLLLVLVVVLAGGLVFAAYRTHSVRTDEFYKTKTSQTAATLAALIGPDNVQELLSFMTSEEYQAVLTEATDKGDESVLREYLEKKGVLDPLLQTQDTMSKYRNLQGAKYVYLVSALADRQHAITLCDPDEPLTTQGLITPNAAEFGQVTNSHIDPTVSNTDYGWLCSAYDPIVDAEGNGIALIGVDIDMTDIMNARHSFLIMLLAFTGTMALLAIGFGIWMMRKTVTKPLEMLSKATDEFASSDTEFSRENIIDLPITSKDEIGDLYRKTREMQISLVDYMDNLTKVTAEKERIGAELSIATQIQADMLPRIFPAFPNRHEFDIYAIMDPAKEVGGDFYDFFLVDDDHLAMVVADVSGKGVPAALFMVIAKTLIKNRAQMGDSPSEVLFNVNNQLCEGNDAELFVTVWLAILDISTGKGWAVNAGHEHPVVRRGNGPFELVVYKHSPAVAVMPGIPFRQHEFELHPGDALFVYSDGVPEATNAAPELFGDKRMLDALNKNKHAEPDKLLPALRREIEVFVGDAPQFDDITMLVLEYKGPVQ